MTNKQLIKTIANETGASKADITTFLKAQVKIITAAVKVNDTVSITDLGKFSLVNRVGIVNDKKYNTNNVKFKPSSVAKKAVN